MAIVYNLFLDRKFDPENVFRKIDQIFHSTGESRKAALVGFSVAGISDFQDQAISERYGFTPHSQLLARLDKFSDHDEAVLQMLGLISEFLKGEDIQAALLLFDSEIPVFAFRHGILIFNSSRGFWDETRLRKVPFPRIGEPLVPLE